MVQLYFRLRPSAFRISFTAQRGVWRHGPIPLMTHKPTHKDDDKNDGVLPIVCVRRNARRETGLNRQWHKGKPKPKSTMLRENWRRIYKPATMDTNAATNQLTNHVSTTSQHQSRLLMLNESSQCPTGNKSPSFIQSGVNTLSANCPKMTPPMNQITDGTNRLIR